MSRAVPSSFPTVSPFPESHRRMSQRVFRRRCHPQVTRVRILASLHRIGRTFRLGLIVWRYLAGDRPRPITALDDVGLSSVSVVSHFVQATPPLTLMVRLSYPSVDNRESWIHSQGFSRLGSLAHHPGRNATPPKLSSPGPFVATRFRATLAAYPHRLLQSACADVRCH